VATERDPSASRPLPTFPPGRPAQARALRPPLTKRMRTGHWVAIDCVVAGFFALIVMAAVHSYTLVYDGRGVFPFGVFVAAGVFVPVALRRRAPMAAFGGLLILAALVSGMENTVGSVIFLAAAFALYSVTLSSSKRTGIAALGLVLALMVIVSAAARDHAPFLLGGAFVPVALANVLAWTTAYSVRQRRLYVVRLQQQAASSAVAEERLRIARELHDVVAHSMSVIAVQAGYGQYVIDDSPEGAREALGAIQVTSREALDEMRRMLGVLRAQDASSARGPVDGAVAAAGLAADGVAGTDAPADEGALPDRDRSQSAPLAPAPGLANLDRLIKRTCGAGVRVSLEVYGEARQLPAGLDLSAYRIVQEALTNVVKHAGSGARCTVHLGYDEGVLAIRVTDDGGPSTTLPGYGGPSAASHPGYPVGAGQGGAEPTADEAAPRVPAGVGVNGAAARTANGGRRTAGGPPGAAGAANRGSFGNAPVNTVSFNTVSFNTAPSNKAPFNTGPFNTEPFNTGHGIIGMRERAHLCGGELIARPLADGGFQVTASLPLTAAVGDAETAV
jgi:signal transduction histidine kinase